MHAYFAEVIGGKLVQRNSQGETINQAVWKPIEELNLSDTTPFGHLLYDDLIKGIQTIQKFIKKSTK